ncbi:hypothetical protein PPYR_13701 [Photinus pyralis]|uniref:DUF4806 domain-containing protein n=1 Tax=Photinus pyralis TaxID=7054 RepID=A0A1Y1NH96_PHOPY|nr:uncharacterized protein LOC116179672 [Photinus pyralis]XP_031355345.1 uncharacterized protein LOC116179672 [Photinus pyralis]KAB0794081.1 hypothetical protein PPYR_13701 [Photinus pyralis]
MAFVGVEFDARSGGGVAIINRNWLTPRKQEVFWPPYKYQSDFDMAVKKAEQPSDRWRIFKLKRKLFESNEFSLAVNKLNRFEATSDVETDRDEEKRTPAKRYRKRGHYFDSEDEDGDMFSNNYDCLRGLQDSDDENVLSPRTPSSTHSALISGCTSQRHVPRKENLTPPIALKNPLNTPQSENALNHILRLVVEIKQQTDQILNRLENIELQMKLANNVPIIGLRQEFLKKFPVKFPIGNVEDFYVCDNYLKDPQNRSQLVSYLATLGGKNVASKTNNILKFILDDSVASGYSFFGMRNNKLPFSECELSKMIIDTVVQTDKCTQKEVEDVIKAWLRHAPARMKRHSSGL